MRPVGVWLHLVLFAVFNRCHVYFYSLFRYGSYLKHFFIKTHSYLDFYFADEYRYISIAFAYPVRKHVGDNEDGKFKAEERKRKFKCA